LSPDPEVVGAAGGVVAEAGDAPGAVLRGAAAATDPVAGDFAAGAAPAGTASAGGGTGDASIEPRSLQSHRSGSPDAAPAVATSSRVVAPRAVATATTESIRFMLRAPLPLRDLRSTGKHTRAPHGIGRRRDLRTNPVVRRCRYLLR